VFRASGAERTLLSPYLWWQRTHILAIRAGLARSSWRVAGGRTPTDDWHTALMSEEPVLCPGERRTRVDARWRPGATALAVDGTVVGCRSMRRRWVEVDTRAQARGASWS